VGDIKCRISKGRRKALPRSLRHRTFLLCDWPVVDIDTGDPEYAVTFDTRYLKVWKIRMPGSGQDSGVFLKNGTVTARWRLPRSG